MIGLLFGGPSGEHEVSIHTAEAVWPGLLQLGLAITGIYMTPTQRLFAFTEESLIRSISNDWEKVTALTEVHLAISHRRLSLVNTGSAGNITQVDILFPLLQGPIGEDGCIQGLCSAFEVPYVGPTVLQAAMSQDKAVCKDFVRGHGIPSPAYVLVDGKTDLSRLGEIIPQPWVIKPRTQGSSIGVSYAEDISQLLVGVANARSFGDQCLVEEYVDGVEVHCYAIRTQDGVKISRVSGTKASGKIYTHEQKMHSPLSARRFVAEDFRAETVRLAQRFTRTIFTLLNGSGLARVDYFLTPSGQLLFNEMNAVPSGLGPVTGANPWAHLGWSRTDMLQELVQHAASTAR